MRKIVLTLLVFLVSGGALSVANGAVLKFPSASVSVGENDAASQITISIDVVGTPTGWFSFDYITSDGTAEGGDDYTGIGDSFTWNLGDATPIELTVPIANDNYPEFDEDFFLTLSNLKNISMQGSHSVTVNIRDDDSREIGFTQSGATVFEDDPKGALEIPVSRFDAGEGSVEVNYITIGPELGYVHTSGTLSWGNNDTNPQNISVPLVNDSIAYNNETRHFSVQIWGALGGHIKTGAHTVSVTLYDDEAGARIHSTTNSEVDEDVAGGQILFTVHRTGTRDKAISYHIGLQDITAIRDQDYSMNPTQIDWAAGETTNKSFTINITNDDLEEDPEQFRIKLVANDANSTLSHVSNMTMNILDDDKPSPGMVQFSARGYIGGEANPNQKIVFLQRVDGLDGKVSIRVQSFDDNAVANVDYVPIDQTLTWENGVGGYRKVYLKMIDDLAGEGDEYFDLKLSEATGGLTIGPKDTYRVNIKDDETEPGHLYRFDTDKLELNEGEAQGFFSALRSAGIPTYALVDVKSIDGTATRGNDFTFTNKKLAWDKVNLKNEEKLSFGLVDDNVAERRETFSFQFANPTGNSGIANPSELHVTIIDNDIPEGGFIVFEKDVFQAGELNPHATISVERLGGTVGPVQVAYSATAKSATPNVDFTPVSGVLEWSAGDGENKTFDVPFLHNPAPEPNEEVLLTLSLISGNAAVGSEATLVILDNETSPVSYFSFPAETVVQENKGILSVPINRGGGLSQSVSVDFYTTDGEAKKGEDYSEVTGTLHWSAGEGGNQPIEIPIINDEDYEGVETFKIWLINPTNGALLPDPASHDVQILSEDPPGVVISPAFDLKADKLTKSETDAKFEITISRLGSKNGAVSVDYRIKDTSTAKIGKHFEELPLEGTLSWDDQQNEDKTIEIVIRNNDLPEEHKTIDFVIENPTDGVSLRSTNLQLTLQSEDVPPIAIEGRQQVQVNERFNLIAHPEINLSTLETVWQLKEGPSSEAVAIESQSELITDVQIEKPGSYVVEILARVRPFGFVSANTIAIETLSLPGQDPLLPSKNMFDASKGEKAEIQLTQAGPTDVIVFDRTGRETIQLLTGFVSNGTERIEWGGLDANGQPAQAGIYNVLIKVAGSIQKLRLILLR